MICLMLIFLGNKKCLDFPQKGVFPPENWVSNTMRERVKCLFEGEKNINCQILKILTECYACYLTYWTRDPGWARGKSSLKPIKIAYPK